MAKKSKMSTNSKVAIALIVILVLAFVVGLLWRYGKQSCWFGHAYNDDGVCARCGYVGQQVADKDEQNAYVENGGIEADEESVVEHGVALIRTDIPKELYSDYGIMPIAESAHQLTATVTPTDAINKLVDWSIAWANENSSWAKGKSVTSYVTVTPTSDGAATANVQCLQAFGEQVVVTATVRDAEEYKATCTYDYRQKFLGFDLSVTHNSKKIIDLVYNKTDVEIDFPFQITSGSSFLEAYGMVYGMGYSLSTKFNLSSVYTKSTAVESFYEISVAPSATFISALKSAGISTSGMSANTYSKSSVTGSSAFDLSGMFYLPYSVYGSSDSVAWANYTKLRSSLKSNVGSTMLYVKCRTQTTDGKYVETIYSIKFTTSSVSTLASGITLGETNYEF